MILTTSEAAERVGVSEATIRKWVSLGYLKPTIPARLRPGNQQMRFHDDEVTSCHYQRKSAFSHQAWETARARFDKLLSEPSH